MPPTAALLRRIPLGRLVLSPEPSSLGLDAIASNTRVQLQSFD